MDAQVIKPRGETVAHERLKRLALLWAQAQGFSACALEARLPRCRYRADLAAYRSEANGGTCTAVFECKQSWCDLRRDNCPTAPTRERLAATDRRRQTLEKHLRVHYPGLRIADTLFPEFDSHDFQKIGHRNYTRVVRELRALQHRLYDSTKFEKLFHYHCANLLFLVVTRELSDEAEIPFGWGALVESDGVLKLIRKPIWLEMRPENQLRFLERIAAAGTRAANRQLEITFGDVIGARSSSFF